MNRGRISADWGFRILEDLEFPKPEFERIETHEAADERIPDPNDQLDRLDRLHDANYAWQNAKNTTFRATRHHAGRRGFWKHASITRAAKVRSEDRALSVKTENRSVNVRLFGQHTNIVRKVARGEIVGPVNDDVVVLHHLHGVFTSKQAIV